MSSSTSSRLQTLTVQRPTLPLHRVRFFDRTPSPITALAFAPTPLPPAHDSSASAKGKGRVGTGNASGNGPGQTGTPELGVLVLARDNGDVEVWGWVEPEGEGQGNWVLDKVLPPTLTHPGVSLMCLVLREPAEFQHKPYKVPRLEDLRLYTAGSDSSDITERCLFTGRILQTYTIPSPPLWAMSVSPTHQYLCLATTSPTLHFLSITPSGLEPPPAHLLRSDALPSRTRTVSIAWGPPRSVKSDTHSSQSPSLTQWEWWDTYLVTGNSDSSFRKFDLLPPDASRPGAGRVALSDRVVVEKQGKGARKNGKGTIVWGVAVLPDHTIVTADSLGSVSFWDAASMAQKQTFRAHKADAMCMTVAAGGRAVFTSGPDQRVCQFVRVDKVSGGAGAGDWALTTTKRAHAHDVRALACFPAYTPAPVGELEASPALAPILASGGWDMSLILTPCGAPSSSSAAVPKVRNPLGRAQVLAPRVAKILFEESYPRKMSYLGGARGTSLISISRAARLVLGRKERSVGVWKVHAHEQGWDKLLDMDFRLRTALTCAVLSDDGRWMAVSDLYETKLFALRPASTGTGSLVPKRIKSFLPTLLGSKILNHLELGSRGSGSSALLFTPDSAKLIMGLAMSGQVVVLELNGDKEAKGEEVSVAQVFKRDDGAVGQGGRVIVPKKEMQPKGALAGKGGAGVNGHLPRAARRRLAREQQQEDMIVANGTADEGMDVDGEGNDEKQAETSDSDSDSEDDSDAESDAPAFVNDKQGRVACMAASADGQWLAVSDLLGKVSIYNLDTLRPHATLPTFPSSPITLLSPPSHPSLFAILLPSQSLVFYDTESRSLLQPTAQLVKLNKALGDQFSAVCGATFEPAPSAAPSGSGVGDEGAFGGFGLEDSVFGGVSSNASTADTAGAAGTLGKAGKAGKVDGKNVKLVVWSGDWVCSARLDLDMVSKQSGKRRRGRGAAQANVHVHGSVQNGPSTTATDASKANADSASATVNGSTTNAASSAISGSAPVPRLSRKRRAREAREARDALERSSIASSPSASLSLNGHVPNGNANGTAPSIPPSPLGSRMSMSNANGDALISTSSAHVHQSSASDPDFYRFTHDAFRSLAAVDWLGSGEMMVVERPMGDFVQDLPGAFFVGTYGRG